MFWRMSSIWFLYLSLNSAFYSLKVPCMYTMYIDRIHLSRKSATFFRVPILYLSQLHDLLNVFGINIFLVPISAACMHIGE